MLNTALIRYNENDTDEVGNKFPAVYIDTLGGSHKINVEIDMPFYYGVVSKTPLMEHEQVKLRNMQLPVECFEPYIAFGETQVLIWRKNHPGLLDLSKPDICIPYDKLSDDIFKIEI